MLLHLIRLSTSSESTLGALYLDGEFAAYSLEDTKRLKKVAGETRIPAGRYRVDLRIEGGLHAKYRVRYTGTGGRMKHYGMLWLRDVPGFEYVYLHVGNKRGHTEGCILVGDTLNNNQRGNGFVGSSRDAYEHIYPLIADAILDDRQDVWIRISDIA